MDPQAKLKEAVKYARELGKGPEKRVELSLPADEIEALYLATMIGLKFVRSMVEYEKATGSVPDGAGFASREDYARLCELIVQIGQGTPLSLSVTVEPDGGDALSERGE